MITISTLVDYLKQQRVLGDINFHGSDDDLNVEIHGLSSYQQANKKRLVCIFDKSLFRLLDELQAALVIIPNTAPAPKHIPYLVVKDPYLAYAYSTQLFADLPVKQGVEFCASIAKSAHVHEQAYIGPHVVIEDHAVIEQGAYISAHCVVGAHSVIAKHTRLFPRVSVYSKVRIGQRCTIHSGAVIGSDGFGFAPQFGAGTENKMWQKIAQLGGVVIGNDVEIGANTTVDRGALEDTEIGNGVIIDNQVQIAHNVKIGDNSAIAGCVGIAGSSIIGRNCRIAGGVGLAGHIEIADNVTITGMSMVTKSIKKAGSYSGGTPLQESQTWRKNAVRFSHLDKILRKITKDK